ncbi:MAG: hypothetical protein WCJ64_23615 [Rhodospirillaceae bacterium]
MTTDADLLAVQRVHADHGLDAALAEIRQRWPLTPDIIIPSILERALAAPVKLQAELDRGAQFDTVTHFLPQERGALMIMVGPEDIAAIHRAYAAGGFEAAMAEGRRRWPFTDAVLKGFVERVQAMSAKPPETIVRRGDRRAFPGPQGRPRRKT